MERTTQQRAEPSMMNQPDLPSTAEEPTGFGRHEYRNLAEKESSCEVTLSDAGHFSEHSHGFRPKRSAHGAIDEMLRESNIMGAKMPCGGL